jgi:hypothetical protein
VSESLVSEAMQSITLFNFFEVLDGVDDES